MPYKLTPPGNELGYHFLRNNFGEAYIAEWDGLNWYISGVAGGLNLSDWSYSHPVSEFDVPNLEKARAEITRLRRWLQFMVGRGGNYARRALMGDDLPSAPCRPPTGMEGRGAFGKQAVKMSTADEEKRKRVGRPKTYKGPLSPGASAKLKIVR